ncbi:YfhO family protein [Candidatus Woesearchaeota archaeon]|nr:YfhO family protein [Candidatus Woesearchaeota archaeon]
MNWKDSHLLFIAAFILIPLIYFSGLFPETPNLMTGDCLVEGDSRNDHLPAAYTIWESFMKFGQIPLWTNYRMSGNPFLAMGTKPVLYPPFLLFMIPFGFSGASNAIFLFNLALSGIGMYLLAYHLLRNRYAAFISGMIYAYSGFSVLWNFNLVEGSGVPYLPLIVLFALKACTEKRFVLYSLLTALSIAMIFHSGSTVIFIHSLLLFGYVLIYKLFGKNIRQRFLKVIIIGVLVGLLTFGFIAIKLLPTLEFMKLTNRVEPYSYERSRGDVLMSFSDVFKYIFKGNRRAGEFNAMLGIVALLLMLLSLPRIKNKNVIFFLMVFIATLLITSPIPLYYPLWKFFPFFDKQKNITRMFIIAVLAGAALSGFGAKLLLDKSKRLWKKNSQIIIFSAIVLLLIMDLMVFRLYTSYYFQPLKDCHEQFNDAEALQFIAKDNDIFRIKVNEVNGIDHTITGVSRFEGIETLYGGFGGLWVPEYLNVHLSIALRSPAAFWGMLNVKYLTSLTPLNISDFHLVAGPLKGCPTCYEEHASGKYVYQNERFLPRAYVVNKSVLIIGDNAKNTMYAILLSPLFNPTNMVIVMDEGKTVSQYESVMLKKFDYILLTPGALDSMSDPILKRYVEGGGTLLPDIVSGSTQITQEDIDALLGSSRKTYEEVEKKPLSLYTQNEVRVDLDGDDGFLVYSSTFPIFEGWHTVIDGKDTQSWRGNGISAVVPLENAKEARFFYRPNEFVQGSIITGLTLVLIAIYLGYRWWRKKAKR